MFVRNPWSRCRFGAGVSTLAFLLVISFAAINYNFIPWTVRRSLTKRSAINVSYNRLQPLVDMFNNASKAGAINRGQMSTLEGTWQSMAPSMLNMSRLQEADNKVSVLLLLIVTTAPSRYDRREAIRATWWKNCDGIEVSDKGPWNIFSTFRWKKTS